MSEKYGTLVIKENEIKRNAFLDKMAFGILENMTDAVNYTFLKWRMPKKLTCKEMNRICRHRPPAWIKKFKRTYRRWRVHKGELRFRLAYKKALTDPKPSFLDRVLKKDNAWKGGKYVPPNFG